MPFPPLPPTWARVLADVIAQPEHRRLERFVDLERKHARVFPPERDVFAAFERTPFDDVKVVLLGQDPYHGAGQAHGLCLSVPYGVRPPPSLANLFKELHADLGVPIPAHGCLQAWAERGVLLLNAVLTVREGEANAHKGRGWETFTDATIAALSARERPVVFALFGNAARKKAPLVAAHHRVIEGVHPSPLSAHAGFFGSRPFSAIDRALAELGHAPIDWTLPPAPDAIDAIPPGKPR
ncbi:MAG: uracil-DNA glycosylase [Polyangiales bacterium]